MIKSRLFENESQLNEFLSSYVKIEVISIETVTRDVYSDFGVPGVKYHKEHVKLWYKANEDKF